MNFEAMQEQTITDLWKEDGLTFGEGLEFGKSYLVTKDYIFDEILEGRLEPVYETEEEYSEEELDRMKEATDDCEGDVYNPDFDTYNRGFEDWED